MYKKYILGFVFVLALGAGLIALRQQPVLASGAPTQGTAVVSNATPTSVSVPVLTDETVLQAMQAYASSSAFMFTGKEYPSLGFFVESMSGKKNADGYYWTLYIDGTLSELGASTARVSRGQSVEWRYQKGTD